MTSNKLPPLSWTVARKLTRLCREHDKSPHLKSLLKSPTIPPYGHYEATPNTFSPLELSIVKFVYPMPNQMYYRPIPRQFIDILRKVWRMPITDEKSEQERWDAAFTFMKLLQQNMKNKNRNDGETEDRNYNFEKLFEEKSEDYNLSEDSGEKSETETDTSGNLEQSLAKYNIKLLSNNELHSGVFLVSHPQLRENVFYKSVIYISDYAHKYGAIGYSINKSLQVPKGQEKRSGGPVISGKHRIAKMKDGKIALQRSNTPPNYSRARGRLMKRLEEERINADAIEKEVTFLNSTEWIAGQLESELESGSWFVVSASNDLMFDMCDSGEKLWDGIMKSLGGEYEDFVNVRKHQFGKRKPRSRMFSLTL